MANPNGSLRRNRNRPGRPRATETVNPVPAYAGVPGILQPSTTQILNYLQ